MVPKTNESREIEIVAVNSCETFRQIRDLRYRVYCEELRAYPEGWEPADAFDLHAQQFCALAQSRVVGCARLVRPSREGFQMVREYGFPLPEHVPPENLLEFSRWIVDPVFRKRHASSKESGVALIRSSLGMDLIRAARTWSVKHQPTTHWITMMSPDGFRTFQKLGWPYAELTEPKTFHGMLFRGLLIPLDAIPSCGEDPSV